MGQDRKLAIWAAVGAGLAAFVLVGGFIGWRASLALRDSKQEVRAAKEIRVALRPYLPPQTVNFEVVRSPEVFLQAVRFQDHLYIAGPAGLSEYDLQGTPQGQFQAGRDLPSSPLVAIASGLLAGATEPELVIATANDALLVFNGRYFRQVYPADDTVRTITSILPVSPGHLLIGTKKRGVLLFDDVPSNNFTARTVDGEVVLHGAGEGHGVGLCQRGGRAMAVEGADFRKIIMHYFPNTTIGPMPGQPSP